MKVLERQLALRFTSQHCVWSVLHKTTGKYDEHTGSAQCSLPKHPAPQSTCVLSQLKPCWVKSWEQLVLFPSSLLPFLPPSSFSHLQPCYSLPFQVFSLISWYILAFTLPNKIWALPLGNTPGYKSQVFHLQSPSASQMGLTRELQTEPKRPTPWKGSSKQGADREQTLLCPSCALHQQVPLSAAQRNVAWNSSWKNLMVTAWPLPNFHSACREQFVKWQKSKADRRKRAWVYLYLENSIFCSQLIWHLQNWARGNWRSGFCILYSYTASHNIN